MRRSHNPRTNQFGILSRSTDNMFRAWSRRSIASSKLFCDHLAASNRQHPWQNTLRCFDILIDPQTLSNKKRNSSGGKKQHQQASRKPSYRFVDKTRVRVVGGPGGKGSLSQQSLRRKHKLRPDGGHGGNGGCVILVADPRQQSLRRSLSHVQAEKGGNGSSKEKLGRNGKNSIVRVPCGVIVRRIVAPGEDMYDDGEDDDVEDIDLQQSQESSLNSVPFASWNVSVDSKNNEGVEFFAMDDDFDEGDDADDANVMEANLVGLHVNSGRKKIYLTDLDKPGSYIMVAKGGRGGLGTMQYSSVHGPLPNARKLIEMAQPEPGEVAFLELELKMIADIGLVGFPNAGM